jgi:hypothetical protein
VGPLVFSVGVIGLECKPQEMNMAYEIRSVDRVQTSPPRGMKASWTDVQVIEDGKVVATFDFPFEAEEFIAKKRA